MKVDYGRGDVLTRRLPEHLFSVGEALGRYKDGNELIEAIFDHDVLKDKAIGKVEQAVSNECTAVCKKTEEISVFRKSGVPQLLTFSINDAFSELCEKASVFMRILAVAASSERELRRQRQFAKRGKTAAILSSAATLLKCRDKDMAAFHHLLALYLYQEGASKQAFRQLSGLGLTTSHTTVLRKIEEARRCFNDELISWKNQLEAYLANPISSGSPVDYQIVVDNLDLEITPHLATTQYLKRSIHWVNAMAVKHRILGNHLSDTGHQRSIDELEPCHILPTPEDHRCLRQNFITFVERVLTVRLKAFAPLKKIVIQHIPHQYSELAKTSTAQVS